jgi:hypothetical protein
MDVYSLPASDVSWRLRSDKMPTPLCSLREPAVFGAEYSSRLHRTAPHRVQRSGREHASCNVQHARSNGLNNAL